MARHPSVESVLGRQIGHQEFYSGCYAPLTSMYLDPRGEVRACCKNQLHRLGNINESSLREIWDGAPIRRLRSHLLADDMLLGCNLCGECLDRGIPEQAFLRTYDGLLANGPTPEWPRQLELALSNACNLQCVMCNGDLSSAIRIHREGRAGQPSVYGDPFFEELDEFLPHLERIVFLGGEPLLGKEPLRVLERLIALELRPTCHITTNGTQFTPRVEAILSTLPVHVSISIDGATAQTNEAIRIGVNHERLLDNVGRIRDATDRPGCGCSVAFSLMRDNWHEFGAVLEWADSLDLDVAVNTVTHPIAQSLHHAAGSELRSVVAAMSSRAPRFASSSRNADVWARELAGLRAVAEGRETSEPAVPEVPVSVMSLGRRIATRAVGHEALTRIVVDGDQLVGEVVQHPEDRLGVNLGALTGDSIQEVLLAVTGAIGAVVSTRLARDENGAERWTVRYGQSGRQVDLVMVLAPVEGDRQEWYLATRPVDS